jgi:D-alanyl-D-alanine carboxypeptidase/D-alanyl-D-alanine-endopeptidase (penicillin-binding protein 4)
LGISTVTSKITSPSLAHVTARQKGRVGLLLVVVVVLLVGAAGTGAGVLWTRGSLNDVICDGDCGSSAIATPDALARTGQPGAVHPLDPAGGRVNPDAVAAAVRGALGAKGLGPHVGFAAIDPSDGAVVGSQGSGGFVPASTTKLLTAIAVLTTVDPESRFTTKVMRSEDRIVLVGGGDPYLATKLPRKKVYATQADLATLAKRTAAGLRRLHLTSVRLDYETSLFSGPDASSAWEKSYVSQKIVTPVSALWADEGVVHGVRADDAPQAATQEFARMLERRGITVSGTPIETKVPSTADPVASVSSATVAEIVEAMIARSDNEAAEVLLRHAALGAGRPASFDGGVATVRAVLKALRITTAGLVLTDGSGLSRKNRIAPVTLADVVATAARTSRTSSLVSDLAVGGFTGTLARRFGKAELGRGAVRGKSGTLTGVHSLAGYVTDTSGTPIAFAVMTDHTKSVNPFVTEAALDRVSAALAGCRCTR